MHKVLIFQNQIPHYRIDFYNEMGKKFKLIVAHSGQPTSAKIKNFEEIIIETIKIGPFNFQKNILKIVKQINPSRIISMFDISWPSTIILLLFKKYRKMYIWWGLDEGRSKFSLFFKLLITKLNLPIIFYHKDISARFIEMGVSENLCYVGNNTFHVQHRIKGYEDKKDFFLFVGTLDKRKKLDVCIESIKKVSLETNKEINLIVIGDGEERDSLESIVHEMRLDRNIIFKGRINSTEKLKEFYSGAIAAISYGQAGLSVLQSFAYGVPYVTHRYAISGGEHKNIIHKENGLLVDESYSIDEAIKDLIQKDNLAPMLGKNAYDYYSNECTLEKMIEGFVKAINHYE